MSENQNSKRVLLDSESDHNHESRLPKESNGYVHSESSQPEDPVEHDADSNDEVESINQVGENGTVLGAEDGSGKEDMFVDCPDELLNSDNRDAVAVTETEEFSEEKGGVEDSGAQEMENGAKDGYAASVQHEFKEEREVFVRGVSNLRGQLKALINQRLLIGENEGELVDRLNKEEIGEGEGIGEVGDDADAPLSEMIKECSWFVKTAVEERLQNEATIRELHAVLFMKDQEIEGLNSRVTEFSVSNDAITCNLSSVRNSVEVSLEKDREIEVVANRMLASLGSVGYREELLDDSVSGKIGQVEKGTCMLIDKYNQIVYEIDQLRQCLSGAGVDVMGQEEYETICVAARDGLVELKRNEVNLVEKVRHLEDENRKLLEQLDKDKEMVDTVNAELGKTKMELEQEKTRCANTKEKLTMAVTKGKALVQQRDSLKQSLAEKSSELEKCLIELQEKSSALEAAELCNGELVRSENLVASLQETISQRNAIFEKVEEILSQTSVPEELQSMDIIERFRWLVDERNVLKDVSQEFHKLKDYFSSIDLPETVSSLDLESQVGWLRESFYQAKDEINTLQDENARTKEAAHNEIDHLSASLSAEFQEKDYLQTELADLMSKYKEILEKEHQFSLEKDQILKMLIEVSGIEMDDEEGVYESFSDNLSLIFRCFEKIKEQGSASFDSSHVNVELFERVQSLLYVRDQELMLSEKLLEEEMLVRSQVDKLLNELNLVSEELVVLKEEKGSLQKDLERSEEKSAVLREKLSIAVKKGKALVQDRENLKNLREEKNSEVEKLKLELQQQESAVADCRDQINRLSIDVERIPTLEADLVAIKDQRDQFEQFLLESNNMLQRVVESIDGIVLPVDSVFEDPVGKVKWLAGYVSECQDGKTHAEQELGKVREEASTLASKLAEDHEIMKSLEDALAVAENNISRLAEEKSEIEVGKTNVELELQKAIEEACSQTSKFAEAFATRKSLEEALSLAENNISILFKEKEEVQVSRAAAETEQEKVKEEIAIQTSKLEEAYKTIKSLEDALSQVETNVALLTEQNNDAQIGRTNLEDEIKKLQEEAGSQANKLADAYATIKSLEDALLREENNNSVLEGEKKNTEEAYKTIKSLEDALSQAETNVALLTEQNNDAKIGRTNLEDEIKKQQEEAGSQANKLADAYATIKLLEDALLRAENNISALEGEKKNTEEEVLSLNLKLNACMEELAGTSGSLASRSVELTGHLTDLQMLMKDETLLSKVKGCFEKKFESLKNMDLILKNITDCFVNKGFEELKSHHVIEDDLHITKPFSDSLEDIVNVEMDNGWVSATDADNISSHFRKAVEGFQSRNNVFADKFEGFSSFIDEFIAALLRKLQATENGVIVIFDHFESLKQTAKNLEVYKQEQETTIATLKNDVMNLLSACTNATRELQFEVGNNLPEFSYVPEHEKLNHNLFLEMIESGGDATAEQHQKLDDTKYFEATEKLLFATRKVQALIKQFESTSNVAAATIEDLQSKLKESRTTFEKAIEERDLNQNRVFGLETDIEALQNSCSELKLKLEDYQTKEDKLKEREAEVSSLYNTFLMKEQEAEDYLLSASQVKALFDKIRGIEIPMAESEVGGLEPHNSVYIRKLFHIIDNVTELQHQVDLLSHDKEDLQSTLATKILEIEHLKDIEKHIRDKQDLEKINELSEVMLEKIIAMLGGSDIVGDQKSEGVKLLLSVLEKQVMTLLLDSENSKSKAQELGTKLLGSQKVVDELSIKVKLLEHSLEGRTAQPEIVQERNIFEAPSPLESEISEIEDAGSLGQGTVSAVPPAAHVRTLRKGSTDHLAINIDVESESLINNEKTDEDKGHVFKSLNTSGLIPKQGKLIADRIDGIWVSGGRVLMSRPQARLGLIAYWLVLHIWLLGTIL